MKSLSINKKCYYISANIKLHFKKYRTAYIILGFLAILGLTTGLITVFKYSSDVETSSLKDGILLSFMEGDVSFFGLYFNRILMFAISMIIIFVSTIKLMLIPLNAMVILFRSYYIGINCAVIMCLIGLSGYINVLFIILPCSLILNMLLITESAIIIKKRSETRRIRKMSYCKIFDPLLKKQLLFIFFIGLVVCMIEVMLLSLTANFIFIVV